MESCFPAEDKLGKVFTGTAAEASVYPSMIVLPCLTSLSSLMGKAVIITHKPQLNFIEPNVLWTAVAAPPGK